MRIQLWSYNYAPEPTGIGPVSATWAQAMQSMGHEVSVVAAYPHYPEPRWQRGVLPRRELIDGIPLVRLPLWVGRDTPMARIRQDATFTAALMAAFPLLPRTDVRIVVSPCFPALAAAITARQFDRKPWLLWLQDILPDGASSTGIVAEDGAIVKLSRKLERHAYRSADRIVVISERFAENLQDKGVDRDRLRKIYNPATTAIAESPRNFAGVEPRILVMGNIGHSQGLDAVVREFESDARLQQIGAELMITGAGVAAETVRAAITTDRVQMRGLVSKEELGELLDTVSLGLVSQRADFPEFNLPSKLMNYLARALPVVAHVGQGSEVASLVRGSGAGWVSDHESGLLGSVVADALSDPQELARRSAAAHDFAGANLGPESLARSFSSAIEEVVS